MLYLIFYILLGAKESTPRCVEYNPVVYDLGKVSTTTVTIGKDTFVFLRQEGSTTATYSCERYE